MRDQGAGAMFVGVDGCPGGWLAAVITELGDQKTLHFAVFPDIASLWDRYGEAIRVLIDIPIGLTDRGPAPRECDRLARRLLKWPRSSSIFPPPCRSALHSRSYEEANAMNRRKTSKGLSKQTWNIFPKIREVDTLLRKNLRINRTLWEAHPELAFWAFNGQQAVPDNKRTPTGFKARWTLVREISRQMGVDADYSRDLSVFPRKVVTKDDYLDAWALVLAAGLPAPQLAYLPAMPPFDSANLPQRITYPLLKVMNRL